MKNKGTIIFLILCTLFTLSSKISAQTLSGSEDNVTLKIILKPIQSIVVTPSQNEVEFVYSSPKDYSEGVKKEMEDHLTVFSTGGFEVSVKAESDKIKRVGGPDALSLSDIKIQVSRGSKTNTNEKYPSVTLANNASNVIESTKGGRDLKYNVSYDNSAGGNDKYLKEYRYIATAGTGRDAIYAADITYTIIAK